ncbi:MAG: response regulator transcription factor [Alistipes sp.]|jgi:Response regulator containing a CheY-like receiver domain and an HTH DNA-binding domain|uniref:response regulator transcription factor n=1 Tax=Alistipes sp. TaxID=1872444 RepID=UPI00399280D9
MNLLANLTRRESQVAELLAWGASRKEAADQLNIATNTVLTISRSIFRKVGIQKATELSVWWFCRRFNISPDLSPVRRRFGATILLMLFLLATFTDHPQAVRRIRRGRRNEYEYVEEF